MCRVDALASDFLENVMIYPVTAPIIKKNREIILVVELNQRIWKLGPLFIKYFIVIEKAQVQKYAHHIHKSASSYLP